MARGRIIKALSGFYYVQDNETNQVWQCRARGVFKKRNISPLVGDWVEYAPGELGEGTVTHIDERKNELIRPPVANVDQALLVFSLAEPDFSSLLLDKFLVHVERAHIVPVICISKNDLVDDKLPDSIAVYEQIGYPIVLTSALNRVGLEELREQLEGRTTVFAGQSGVGKSSLLNAINPEYELETKEISKSLGRGKHTTRHVELLQLPYGGYVVDTPGFSQLEFQGMEPVDLSECFIELQRYAESCKFRGCLHKNEPKCAVKAAVEEGVIAAFRYAHYLQFLQQIEEAKQKRGY